MNLTWAQVKTFLARLFSRGREGVETLAESLDRQAALQRLAAQGRRLKHQRQELLVTMGKKVYALHRRGKVRNRDVLGDCKRIDEIGEELAQLQQQIEEIRRRGEVEAELELADETDIAEEEPQAEAAAEAPVVEEAEPEAATTATSSDDRLPEE